MNIRLAALLTTAAVSVAIGVGCGGSDDSTSASVGETAEGSTSKTALAPITTSSVGKAAVIKNADVACRQTRAGLIGEQEAYLATHNSEELPQGELVANMTKTVLLPKIEAEIEKIRKLGAPAGDEKQVEAILLAQLAGVDEVAGLRALETNEALEAPFAEANKMRKGYGFRVCSYIP